MTPQEIEVHKKILVELTQLEGKAIELKAHLFLVALREAKDNMGWRLEQGIRGVAQVCDGSGIPGCHNYRRCVDCPEYKRRGGRV